MPRDGQVVVLDPVDHSQADDSPMPTGELRRELALAHFPMSSAKRDYIRQLVDDYVTSAQAREWPPERALLALVRIAADEGVAPSSHVVYSPSVSERDRFLAEVIGWCLQPYYGESRAQGAALEPRLRMRNQIGASVKCAEETCVSADFARVRSRRVPPSEGGS